jgi:hypothetical protein
MSLVYPFVACADSKLLRKPQVRLTHQSVKDWVCKRPGSTLSAVEENRRLNLIMLEICVKYLLLDDIANQDLLSEEQAAFAELPQLSESSSDDEESLEYDPNCTWESWEDDMAHFDPVDRGFGEFFVYASCHWIDHFGAITAEPFPSLDSIERLCHAGSTRLSNWIQQNSRPGCTILPRFEFDSNLYDPLSITSIYGSEAMLLDMLENSDLDNHKFLESSVMKAADQILQWGDVSRVKILFLDDRHGMKLQNLDFFRLLIERWDKAQFITNPWYKERQNWDTIFGLLEHVLIKMIEEHWGNELLCLAAGAGCMPIVQRLMNSARHNEDLKNELLQEARAPGQHSTHNNLVHRSVGLAVLGNHVSIVELLLGEDYIENHLRYRNSHGENVLHLASRACNPEMFRLLLPRFPEGIDAEDDEGVTPLVRIIMSPLAARYESASVILSQSCGRWNSQSLGWQRNALRAAVLRLDLDMCCILICTGKISPVSALSTGCKCQTDMKSESSNSEYDLLGTLIDLFNSVPEYHLAQTSSSVERALQHWAKKHFDTLFAVNYR